jgi:hypothetical protein
MAFINIVTPCSRPESLRAIADSINIAKNHYRWIVVFDADEVPSVGIPANAEAHAYHVEGGSAGHAQRNFANKMIQGGYVLQIDDDTILHPDFWEAVKDCTEDLVCWKQCHKDGLHRLNAGEWHLGHIDSGSFMADRKVIGDSQWIFNRYDADGYFAQEMRAKTESVKTIQQYLSFYNYLR